MTVENVELAEEIESINAIYGDDTLTIDSTNANGSHSSALDLTSTSSITLPTTTTLKLQIPEQSSISFLLGFDAKYPDTPPRVLGTASTGARGEGKKAVDILVSVVGETWQAGLVCLFDVISEAGERLAEIRGEDQERNKDDNGDGSVESARFETELSDSAFSTTGLYTSLYRLERPPPWILSEVITEKKSVFVARAAAVSSKDEAAAYLEHLKSTDKRVANATHNITAWRIKMQQQAAGGAEIVVQDCDDDGETAAGGRLLHLMQLMDVWNVMVVVSRWFGGVKLGPDRFRIINAAGRDALVRGGFFTNETNEKNDKAKKKGKK